MSEITLEQVKSWALAEIEKEGRAFIYKGDERDGYVLPECYYYEHGQPSCLVGRMLANNGIIAREDVEGEVDENGTALNEVTSGTLIEQLEIDISPNAAEFLRALQSHQDSGNTWGTAYDEAVLGNEIY